MSPENELCAFAGKQTRGPLARWLLCACDRAGAWACIPLHAPPGFWPGTRAKSRPHCSRKQALPHERSDPLQPSSTGRQPHQLERTPEWRPPRSALMQAAKNALTAAGAGTLLYQNQDRIAEIASSGLNVRLSGSAARGLYRARHGCRDLLPVCFPCCCAAASLTRDHAAPARKFVLPCASGNALTPRARARRRSPAKALLAGALRATMRSSCS